MTEVAAPVDLLRPAASTPEIVDVPAMQFVMVDGSGDPNTSTAYREAVEALYGVAYGIRFMLKRERGLVFPVGPLEGLWWAPDMAVFSASKKHEWRWTAMISVPDAVTDAEFERARTALRQRHPSSAVERLRLERFREGRAAQVMHIGPYAAEAPTIERLHAFIRERGHTFDGRVQKHHEIYLGDPRRARPEKLRTVIRQPFVD